MKPFLFVIQMFGTLRIMAENQDHAWDIYAQKGFLRSECLSAA